MEERSGHRISFIIRSLTQDLEFCPSKPFLGMRFALAYPEEGYHMHDPALWTNWYVALLLFPFMIIALLLRDFLAGRGRRR
jgi:hypothetical protein